MTNQNPSTVLSKRICKISRGDRDLIEQDRRDFEQTGLHRHCKRVWQQLNSKERESIRSSVKKETTLFDGAQCSEFLIDAHCIKRVQELIQKSGSDSYSE